MTCAPLCDDAIAPAMTGEQPDRDTPYNAILVTGANDPVTGQPVSAISYDEESIAFYGIQIDGAPVSNLGCKTAQDCANYGAGLLNQFSLARSSNQFTVFVRNDQAFVADNVGQTTQGDVIRAIANTTVSGFEDQPYGADEGQPYPAINGLGVSVKTTIDFTRLDRWQDVSFSAIQPNWSAALQERANALATALTTNQSAGNGIDQYFVDTTAYNNITKSPTSLAVSVGPFMAIFAQGTSPVPIGSFNPPTQSSFTCYASSLNFVWIALSGSSIVWNVQQNNATAQAGQILYAIVQTSATGVLGFQPKAPTGLIETPGSYLIDGSAYVPVASSITDTIPSRSFLHSPISVQWTTTQPTDGSYASISYFYRQTGQPYWLFLASDVPRDASASPLGEPLTSGATSATGNYQMAYPDATNGCFYDFGYALVSLTGTETEVVELVTDVGVSISAPGGATMTLAAIGSGTSITIDLFTPQNTYNITNATIEYTIAGTSNTDWIDHFEVYLSLNWGSTVTPLQFLTRSGGGGSLTGTISCSATGLPANMFPSEPVWAIILDVRAVALDGTYISSSPPLGFNDQTSGLTINTHP